MARIWVTYTRCLHCLPSQRHFKDDKEKKGCKLPFNVGESAELFVQNADYLEKFHQLLVHWSTLDCFNYTNQAQQWKI